MADFNLFFTFKQVINGKLHIVQKEYTYRFYGD